MHCLMLECGLVCVALCCSVCCTTLHCVLQEDKRVDSEWWWDSRALSMWCVVCGRVLLLQLMRWLMCVMVQGRRWGGRALSTKRGNSFLQRRGSLSVGHCRVLQWCGVCGVLCFRVYWGVGRSVSGDSDAGWRQWLELVFTLLW